VSDMLLSPFSNSDIRDWPSEHYAALIDLLLARWQGCGRLRVIGTRGQALRACEIVRGFSAERVVNECGRLNWPQAVAAIKSAACVIGNNSGIAHLAGFYGVPTVCVFGGSHQRLEWRPLGFSVALVSRSIGCSPCHRDHNSGSPFGKACLREITPESVAEAVFMIMARVDGMWSRDAGSTLAASALTMQRVNR
jgi:ADP-heptose:LPS heptosyltransferase